MTDPSHTTGTAGGGYEIRLRLPAGLPRGRLLALFSLVSGVFLVFGGALRSLPGLPDRESYLHLGFTRLMLDEGFVRRFPWMTLSTLEEAFADPHVLLHVVMLPLVAVGIEPVAAGKLAAVLMVAALAVGFYLALVRLNARWPLAFTALMLAASPYLFGQLCRVGPAALFFLLLAAFAVALKEERPVLLFGLSWLAAYLSAGFVLLLALALSYALFSARQQGHGRVLARICAPVVAGILAGTVLNPYFPNNLSVLEVALIDQAFFRPAGVAPGAGWSGNPGSLFLQFTLLPLLLLGIAALLAAHARSPADPLCSALYFTTALLFLLAMRWSWAVGAFAVTCVMLCALLVSRAFDAHGNGGAGELRRRAALGLFLFLFVPVSVLNLKTGLLGVERIAYGIRPGVYRTLSGWLQENSKPGEIVVADRDDFPLLFYFNRHNRYLYGLSPIHAHARDRNLYLVHRVLYRGNLTDPHVFLEKLGARFLLLARTDLPTQRKVVKEGIGTGGRFEKVASVGHARLYRLRDQTGPPKREPGAGKR